jgi:hypothetical protein
LPASCDIDASAMEIEKAAAAWRAEPGFQQALRFQLAENASKVGSLKIEQQQLAALVAAIEGR